ncbi:GNAT family N-acetyltransferase [Halolamina salifodinae]|uniref:GNAT superfamily N-acetyltransferase n=1 Tax=Halolamina salifodinae TaxID=1202767 RepID=A0A8T4GRB5_9EURY|nr:GNAT family N-acetyltransferase [Halolamina salifodinae]MBP1985681.1 GNAT superfamily N-acetyltransferase [Halolamina salifodinae]
MEFALLGWPDAGPTLRLDFREFSYAGKFVMSNTGKAVARDPDGPREAPPSVDADLDRADPGSDEDPFERDVVAAAAFNADRTDPGVLWIRYITTRHDRRGEGIGARLAAFVAERAERQGFRRCRIAVNNPFAYHALYKAGFVFTGRETGLAELVLERPGQRDAATYQCGLDTFRTDEERNLSDEEDAFLGRLTDAAAPDLVATPAGGDADSDASEPASH